MRDILKVTDVVKTLLKENPRTRNSDDYLYAKVCERYNSDVLRLDFGFVLANRKDLGLPCFESVRRSRQKLQELHPELAGTGSVKAARKVNEAVVSEYARNYGGTSNV